jgi:hypothetical protein
MGAFVVPTKPIKGYWKGEEPITPLRQYVGSAGAKRVTASLTVVREGVVAVGPQRVAANGRVFVWHEGDRGTYHGVYDAATLASAVTPDPARASSGLGVVTKWDAPTPRPAAIAVIESASGAGHYVAAAYAAPQADQKLAIVTSGYDSRSGWSVIQVGADYSVQAWPAQEWVATFCGHVL